MKGEEQPFPIFDMIEAYNQSINQSARSKMKDQK